MSFDELPQDVKDTIFSYWSTTKEIADRRAKAETWRLVAEYARRGSQIDTPIGFYLQRLIPQHELIVILKEHMQTVLMGCLDPDMLNFDMTFTELYRFVKDY